jgi:hypothetical protein
MNPRKLNSPPGSQNPLKGSVDSHAISLSSTTDPLGMPADLFTDELSLARIYLSKALQERDNALQPKEKLAWDLSSRYWLETIIKIKRQTMEYSRGATDGWESFIEAIRLANEKQSVKR